MAQIELDRVGLTFKVRKDRQLTLKEFLIGQMFRRSKNPIMEVRRLCRVRLWAGFDAFVRGDLAAYRRYLTICVEEAKPMVALLEFEYWLAKAELDLLFGEKS